MLPGDLVADRYRLVRIIGRGGMGVVWEARREVLDRAVALKIIDPPQHGAPVARLRALAEARAVGKLRHPNVIDVIDVGELPEGRLFIVFELLSGPTLADYLEQHGRLAPRVAVRVCIEICHGLASAHAAGIVHRDLKPQNVLLHQGAGGGTTVKLLDFGISKSLAEEDADLGLTDSGVVFGTAEYMSVEQARGQTDVDHRSDVWSVGVVLYELLAGVTPFTGSNYNAILSGILASEPPPLGEHGVAVAPALERVVMRCLVKDRDQRVPTVAALCRELEALEPELPEAHDSLTFSERRGAIASVRPPPPPFVDLGQPVTADEFPGPGGARGAPRMAWRAGGAAALALVGGALVWWSGARPEPHAPPAAQPSAATAFTLDAGPTVVPDAGDATPLPTPEIVPVQAPSGAASAAVGRPPSLAPLAPRTAVSARPAPAPTRPPLTGVDDVGF